MKDKGKLKSVKMDHRSNQNGNQTTTLKLLAWNPHALSHLWTDKDTNLIINTDSHFGII